MFASKHELSGGGYGVMLHSTDGDDIRSQVAVTLGNGSTGTMSVQGAYFSNGSFGSAGSAVSLTAGAASAGLQHHDWWARVDE